MKAKDFMQFFGRLSKFANAHKRELFTIVAIGGELIAIIEAVKEGPKFREVIDEYNARKDTDDPMTKGEVVKDLAIPTLKIAIPAGLSIGATGMHYKVASDAIGHMGTLLGASRALQSEYLNVVKNTVGEEKAEEIEGQALKRSRPGITHEECPTKEYSAIIPTGHGTDVFLDKWIDRKFYSDINYIKKVVNDLNYQLMNEHWISLNEFYQALGLPITECGRDIGWNVDYGQIDLVYYVDMDENDRPITIMGFKSQPCWRYEERKRW